MASGMESFLTGFATQTTKGLEKGQDTFNKLFGDSYNLRMKQQIPEYEYRSVKGVGLVYVNKADPNDIRVAIKEKTPEELRKSLTDNDVRAYAQNGGNAKEEDYSTLRQYGIPPERITRQEGGGLLILGEKQIQEDNKQKINNFEKVSGEINEKSRYSDTGRAWIQKYFSIDSPNEPKYPVEVTVEEYNKIKDIEGVDSTSAEYIGLLQGSKLLTKKVFNEQIKDVLNAEGYETKGMPGTGWFGKNISLLKFIKSEMGNLEEDKITAEHIRNQYNELVLKGTIKSVPDVEGLIKKEKELMKLDYGGVQDIAGLPQASDYKSNTIIEDDTGIKYKNVNGVWEKI